MVLQCYIIIAHAMAKANMGFPKKTKYCCAKVALYAFTVVLGFSSRAILLAKA